MTILYGGFFLFVLVLVMGAGYFLLRMRPLSEGAVVDQGSAGAAAVQPIVTQALHSIGETLPIRGKQADALRARLFRAGFRDPASVTIFQGCRAALAAVIGLLALWLGATNEESSAASMALSAVAAAGAASFAPDRWLDWRVRARATRIRTALPPGLELMTLAVEAGQPLDFAIQSTARALRRVHPDLCDELSFYLLETRAGTSRLEALAHLAERSPEAELKKVAAVLADTERFGNSLGPALRTHSKYLRTSMRFRAQASARKLGVKLVFPVFFLIFPSVLLVTLGPAYLQIQQFFRTMIQ
jgi:tight adherence protein C